MAVGTAAAAWVARRDREFSELIRSGGVVDQHVAEGRQQTRIALYWLMRAEGEWDWPDDIAPAPETVGACLFAIVTAAREVAVELGWQPQREIIPPRLRTLVYRRDGYACVACGADDVLRLTIDHRIPVDLGGSRHPSNLRTLCKSCNSAKGSRL